MKSKLSLSIFTVAIFIPMFIISGVCMYQSHPIMTDHGGIQLSYNHSQFNGVIKMAASQKNSQFV